ncbi:MAG: SURF1 family cytochrome oxidase biogenesis protein [Acidimicrobiales bacterium]
MYRFALRPGWILSHLFVLALVAVFVSLGLWQLRRLDEKRDQNELVTSRITQPVADAAILPEPGDAGRAADLEFRRVRVTGRFLADEQVLVRSRSLDDSPGSWVLAPLQTGEGTVVVVNRGWIANNGAFDAVPTEYTTPRGTVTVTGIVMQTRSGTGSDPRIQPPDVSPAWPGWTWPTTPARSTRP